MQRLFILALIVITCRPWPSPDLFGSAAVRMAEASVFATLSVIAAVMVMHNNFRFPASPLFWGYVAAAFIGVYFSLMVNFPTLQVSDYIEFLRPLYMMVFMLIGYLAYCSLGRQRMTRTLFYTFIAVGLLQVPISIMQIINPGFAEALAYVWTAHKVEVASLRATGLFGNPNHLGQFLILAQLAALIQLSGWKRLTVWGVLFFGVVLTGSLSTLILGLIITALFCLYRQYATGNLRLILGSIAVLGIFGMGSTILLANTTLEDLPRLERFRAAIFDTQSGGLLELSNVRARFATWAETSDRLDLTDPLTVIFGSGPMKGRGLDYMDNEPMFILFRHGALGLMSALIMLGLLMRGFFSREGDLAIFGRFTVLFFLLLTPAFEVFSLWRAIPFYLLPFGAALAMRSGAAAVRPQ